MFSLLGFAACSSDDESIGEQPVNAAPIYFPTSNGSYWVYNTYEVEATGSETLYAQNDTVFALGDTVIDGVTYHKFNGKRFTWGPNYDRFVRDSSGYVIELGGHIVMSYTNFDDVLTTQVIGSNPSGMKLTRQMEQYAGPIELPAGSFSELLNLNVSIYAMAAEDSLVGMTNNFYAPGIGQITKTYFYGNQYMEEQTYFEERLVGYYIETP